MLARFLIPVAIGLAIWAIPPPAGVSEQAMAVLAVFVATIAGIIAKPLPMGAVAMIALAVLAVTKTLTTAETLSGFSNATIWLIVVAFFIARGFIKTGPGTRIAYLFVARLGATSLGVSYGLLATDLVLAPAIPSNTARAGGVINPIVRSVSEAYGSRPDDGTARRLGSFLTLTAFNVNCVTSAMFLTAMAANPLAQELAADVGVDITWGKWALAASVPGIAALVVLPWLLHRTYPPEVTRTPEATGEAKARLAAMGPRRSCSPRLLGCCCCGPSAPRSSTAPPTRQALLVSRVLSWDDIKQETGAWDTLVWFAALVMMATKLNELGFIGWFSGEIADLVDGFGWLTAFAILSLVYFYSHYFFASNTAPRRRHVRGVPRHGRGHRGPARVHRARARVRIEPVREPDQLLERAGARVVRRRLRAPRGLVALRLRRQRGQHRHLDLHRRPLDEAPRHLVTPADWGARQDAQAATLTG